MRLWSSSPMKMAVAASLGCLIIAVAFAVRCNRNRERDVAAHISSITTMSGRVLNGFFDDLIADPKRVSIMRSQRRLRTCGSEGGLLQRIGRIVGIGAVAYA
jgi:hypothetical protein